MLKKVKRTVSDRSWPGAVAAASAVIAGQGMIVCGLAAAAALTLTGREIGRTRSVGGDPLPAAALVIGAMFTGTWLPR
jgi:hypothetical protein